MRPSQYVFALCVLGNGGQRRLVAFFRERTSIVYNGKGRTEPWFGGKNLGRFNVLANGVKGHASTVNAPSVGMERIQLGGDERLEDGFVHRLGDPVAVVEHAQIALAPLGPAGKEDHVGMGITGVAQHLDDHILEAADVLLRLPALSFSGP